MSKKIKTYIAVAILAAAGIFAAVQLTHSVKADKAAVAEPSGSGDINGK